MNLHNRIVEHPQANPIRLIWIHNTSGSIGKSIFCRWFKWCGKQHVCRFEGNEQPEHIMTVLEHESSLEPHRRPDIQGPYRKQRLSLDVVLFDLKPEANIRHRDRFFTMLKDLGDERIRTTAMTPIRKVHIVCFANWLPTNEDLVKAGCGNSEHIRIQTIDHNSLECAYHDDGSDLKVDSIQPDTPPAAKRRPPVAGTADD